MQTAQREEKHTFTLKNSMLLGRRLLTHYYNYYIVPRERDSVLSSIHGNIARDTFRAYGRYYRFNCYARSSRALLAGERARQHYWDARMLPVTIVTCEMRDRNATSKAPGFFRWKGNDARRRPPSPVWRSLTPPCESASLIHYDPRQFSRRRSLACVHNTRRRRRGYDGGGCESASCTSFMCTYTCRWAWMRHADEYIKIKPRWICDSSVMRDVSRETLICLNNRLSPRRTWKVWAVEGWNGQCEVILRLISSRRHRDGM